MLAPKRVKHRKVHRGRMKGKAKGHTEIQYGDYAIVALGAGLDRQPSDRGQPRGDDPSHQARWEGVDHDLPRQARHEEARGDPHGLREGQPGGWVAVVKPGRVMFELSGVNEPLAREAMLRAQHKLPIRTKFITRVGE